MARGWNGKTTPAANRRDRRMPTRLGLERLEQREVPATLSPIANQTVPTLLGLPVVLTGGSSNQTYTATSSNSAVQAQVVHGTYLSVSVSHTADPTDSSDITFSGTIVFQLYDELTPVTVERILNLVQQGFYTSPTQPQSGTALPNKNFHRVVPGFVVQGGSNTGDGSTAGSVSQPGYPFADEFVQQLVFTGGYQVAMANGGDDTNDSQFFITAATTTDSLRNLDYNHTIFGQVVAGQSVVDQMFSVARNGETPKTPILITATTTAAANPNGTLIVNATNAGIGQTATITVTATDPSDNSTTTQTFQVNVGANTSPSNSSTTLTERPFISTPISNKTVATNQPAVFQIPFTNANVSNAVAFTVQGGITGSGSSATFTSVQNATATVDANGIVTVTPTTGFTGTINLVVGVRSASSSSTAVASYDTQMMTITVRAGSDVNLTPIATPATVTIPYGTPTTVQLRGLTANPNSSQTLVYEIVSGPTKGTITNFNSTTGQLTYTPPVGITGTDSLSFRVTDSGAPTPNLTSSPATVTLTIGGADTGSVRVISNVLVVQPPPGPQSSQNRIFIAQVGSNIVVYVNGILDKNQPNVNDIDRLVVSGTKAKDVIVVDQSVTLPALLMGGTGGKNRLKAGGGESRLHGWFGKNRLQGGAAKDQLFGMGTRVNFLQSAGDDLVFVGQGRPGRDHHTLVRPASSAQVRARPPLGQFFRFKNGKLTAIPTPKRTLAQSQHPVGRQT